MDKRQELMDFMDRLVFKKRWAEAEEGVRTAGESWDSIFEKVADYVELNWGTIE